MRFLSERENKEIGHRGTQRVGEPQMVFDDEGCISVEKLRDVKGQPPGFFTGGRSP